MPRKFMNGKFVRFPTGASLLSRLSKGEGSANSLQKSTSRGMSFSWGRGTKTPVAEMEYEISILNQQVVALQEQVDQLTSVAPMAGEQSATERLTLRLKRKGGQLGIGIRSDNFVKEVDAGGAAEDAGFLPGDWIVSVGGTVVVNEDELTPLLQAVGAAATTAIVIRYSPTAFPDRVVPGNVLRRPPKRRGALKSL